MTSPLTARLALASFASALVLAAAPALAQDGDARVPGNRYVVLNQTGAPLACRYLVIAGTPYGRPSAGWADVGPIAVGGQFNRTAQGPGETVSLDCNPEGDKGKRVTVRPGVRYSAAKGDDGQVVVARVRT